MTIPLICEEIAASLDQTDIAHCTLVSSDWNEAFSRVLWKNLFFHRQQDVAQFQRNRSVSHDGSQRAKMSPMQQGLIRNKDYVLCIHSVFCYTFQSSLLGGTQPETLTRSNTTASNNDAILEQPFPNLVRLETLASELHNKGIVDNTNTEKLLQFVTLNTTLTTIVLINFPLASVKTSKLLGVTLETHENLNSVTISCFKTADRSSIRHVLRGAALGNVQKLVVICRSTVAWDDEPLAALEPTASSPFQLLPEGYQSGLKDLTLEASLTHALDKTLLPLLRHCPNLRRLYIPQLAYIAEHQDSIVEQDLGPALKTWCPNLRDLDLGCSLATDKAMVSLLNNCRDLRSLTFSSPNALGSLSTQALVGFHATLERLDIGICTGVDSKDLQLVLTSCPNLTVLKTVLTMESSSGNENGHGGHGRYHDLCEARIEIQDLPLGAVPAWVCLKLRVLQVGFSGFTSLGGVHVSDQNEIEISATVHRYVDHIYSQLSKLTELRTLVLAGEREVEGNGITSAAPTVKVPAMFDFSLSGGLNQLESLHHLQELDLTNFPQDKIADDEVVWMKTHWPRLQRVIGYNGKQHFDRAKAAKSVTIV
ncbi:hypothetical protein EMPS_07432 [Entomortierella parvispora]|uniref:F-box domain-containing protein n=1 Tax=Entomortierella parvispora TaxID=205924 RepID=A0A9P3HEA2_9FUNG|nr:hypothetical protein EMPS_07432 [Entomortierella parvispora]